MGFYWITSACVGCGTFLMCNPNYVPVLVMENGNKEPICADCHARWNEIHRTSKGLEPIPLHPRAYEPQEE